MDERRRTLADPRATGIVIRWGPLPAGPRRRTSWARSGRLSRTSQSVRRERQRVANGEACGASLANPLYDAAISAVINALKAKDPYTWGHSKRVSAYASGIARVMGLGAERIALIRTAAELHDIGKIGVPDRLLSKSGRLTVQEYQRVMEHPVIGVEILRPLLPENHLILSVVRWHHERADGRGTPDGLRGDQTPLAARIVAVADAFDAMTSARPYRAPLRLDDALMELKENTDTQFHGACVRALCELFTARSAAAAEPTVVRA